MKRMKRLSVLLAMMVVMSISTSALAAETPAAKKDIVDTAVATGDFKILAAALEKTGLVETLKGNGPFTVFAPTDQAFMNLEKELGVTQEELLARKDLKTILLYHVLNGSVMSSDLKNGMMVDTLAQKKVTISLGPIRVNKARVIQPDIKASNGVIHVIDRVLLPPEE